MHLDVLRGSHIVRPRFFSRLHELDYRKFCASQGPRQHISIDGLPLNAKAAATFSADSPSANLYMVYRPSIAMDPSSVTPEHTSKRPAATSGESFGWSVPRESAEDSIGSLQQTKSCEMVASTKTFDEVLSVIRGSGFYQKWILGVVCVAGSLLSSPSMYVPMFVSAVPQYQCKTLVTAEKERLFEDSLVASGVCRLFLSLQVLVSTLRVLSEFSKRRSRNWAATKD